jgi:hypothetical protein
MAKPEAVFIYIGAYPSEEAARADYDKDETAEILISGARA